MKNTIEKRKIILFVPGYYGSILVKKKSSKVRWVRLRDFFLGRSGISTTVPGTNIIANEELVPSAVLKYVTVIPFLMKIDSYGKTLKMLQKFAKIHQMTIETSPYDWRDDFVSSLKLIDKKIKGLNLSNDDELYVVSHSTGALLMAYYLRYGAQDVDDDVEENWEGLKYIKKAVLAAAPFHGLMVLLRDMEHGTTQGFNRELMSARDYSSFKSSYMFLPPKGEDIGYGHEDQKEMILNLHDPKTWEKNNWGLFKFIEDSQKDAAKEFIGMYMSRSQKFHDLLRAPIKNNPHIKIPLLYTWGADHKTVQKGFVNEGGNGKEVKFPLDKSRVEGDGTVTAESGKPLDYFKSLDLTLLATSCSHLKVVASKENQKNIQEFILKK
jgi:alpha-beta hydrolase superfamily lysophospholipase